MGHFSRWMPPAPQPTPSEAGGVVLALLTLGLVFLIVRSFIVAALVLAALAAVTVALNARRAKRLARLADARAGEDIGTFARAFDRRASEFDPWAVRAVWDVLQPYVEVSGRHMPIRPSDRLVNDLDIDDEDLEDLAVTVATRVGRAASKWESNPLNGSVETVGDLVRLIALQPRVPA